MSKVLIITTSVNPKEKSNSLGLLDRYMSYYKPLHPDDEIETIDLNESFLGQDTLTAKNFSTYWDEKTLAHINHLKEIDKMIIASPMYNFNIPAMLKNYIDHISLANETFSYKYSKKGDAIGLIPHLKVQLLCVQGAPFGWYTWGNHVEYLTGAMEFLGAKISDPVRVDGVKTAPLNKMTPSEIMDQFDDKIKKAAEEF